MEHITNKQSIYTFKDRYGEIQSLVEEPALLIIGGPGSGKTEKLCWIMAYHCHQGHQVKLINPFAPPWRYKGLRVFGRNLNYSSAALGLREFVEEVNKRIHFRDIDPSYDPFNELHIHLAIDEISIMRDRISQHDETIMLEFWKIEFQSLKKINMSVSIVSHGDIHNLMLGKETSHSDSAARGIFPQLAYANWGKIPLTRLYCKSIIDPIAKHRKCAGWAEKVTVSASDRLLVTKIDIPDWMIAPTDYNYEASRIS